VCLFGFSKEYVTRMLNIVHEFGEWSGLKLEHFSPGYGNQVIPSMGWENTYRYLGVTFSRQRSGVNRELAEKILQSRLTEWQKIDALNTFAISKFDHFLHSTVANSSWADKLDSDLRKQVKKHLRLPTRTICPFFHLPTRLGGLGLRSVSRAWDSATISRVVKMLSSSDVTVLNVAWDQLRATIQKRMGTPPATAYNAFTFLNSPPQPNEGSRGDVLTLWSIVRRPLWRLGMKVAKDEEGRVLLQSEEVEALGNNRRAIAGSLRATGDAWTLTRVTSSSDQGRSFPLISQHYESNSWIPTGRYVR